MRPALGHVLFLSVRLTLLLDCFIDHPFITDADHSITTLIPL